MKKKLLASAVLAALLSTTALADTSSMSTTTTGMGVLANDFVTAGVNGTTGTFGSGGNTSPGLLYDSTGTGTFNTSYDYLTPGSPFDGFSVMVDGTNYTNNNGGSAAITGDGNGLTDGTNTLSWTGGVTSVFDITNTYTLGTTSEYVDISSQITMGTAATDVYFGRFIDPDARAAAGDSSSTDNVLGYGVIPDSNVAFSEALSSRYALGLYSTDTNVDAGITGWTTDANSYTENAVDGDGSLTNTGDNTIGLSWHWETVSSGDILTASYAYIFGPSAFDAADTAITGGAGGGDTTTTDSWGTLEDVGSATDAAEGTTTPDPTISSYDYTTATYDDTVTAGTVGIIGTGTHAVLDSDGLYSTRTATFGGTLSMTRDSDVTATWSDSSTTTESVSETFTRTVSGTHSDVMSDYTIGTSVRTSQGITWNEATLTASTTEENNLSTTSIDVGVTGEETYAVATPYTYTYDRTTLTTTADDFSSTSGYDDATTADVETTSVETATYTHNTTETEDRLQGVRATIVNDVNSEDVMLDINKAITRNTTFGTIGGERFDSTYGVYNSSTNMFRLGNTIQSEDGLSIGFGIHKIDSDMKGTTSSTQADGTQLGVTVGRETNGWNLSATAQHTMLDFTHTNSPILTLEAYGLQTGEVTYSDILSPELETSGTNSSVSFLAVGLGDVIRPIVGATHGKQKVKAQSAELFTIDDTTYSYGIEEINDTYSFATVGAQLSVGPATLTGLHHTDGVNNVSLGIEKTTGNVTWNAKAGRTMTDLGDTNSFSAGISIKF